MTCSIDVEQHLASILDFLKTTQKLIKHGKFFTCFTTLLPRLGLGYGYPIRNLGESKGLVTNVGSVCILKRYPVPYSIYR